MLQSSSSVLYPRRAVHINRRNPGVCSGWPPDDHIFFSRPVSTELSPWTGTDSDAPSEILHTPTAKICMPLRGPCLLTVNLLDNFFCKLALVPEFPQASEPFHNCKEFTGRGLCDGVHSVATFRDDAVDPRLFPATPVENSVFSLDWPSSERAAES